MKWDPSHYFTMFFIFFWYW